MSTDSSTDASFIADVIVAQPNASQSVEIFKPTGRKLGSKGLNGLENMYSEDIWQIGNTTAQDLKKESDLWNQGSLPKNETSTARKTKGRKPMNTVKLRSEGEIRIYHDYQNFHRC